MYWYLEALKNSFDFHGRACRAEYWIFSTVHWLIYLLFLTADVLLGTTYDNGFTLLAGIYSALTLVPGLSLAVRRLHDINYSGWWLAAPIVPLCLLMAGTVKEDVGSVALSALLFLLAIVVLSISAMLPGTPGYNDYGPNPLQEAD